MSQREKGDVLDFGCGSGIMFPLLNQAMGEDKKIFAIDINPSAIKLAKTLIEKFKLKNVTLFDQDKQLETIEDNSLMAITALDVLEHIKHDELEELSKLFSRKLCKDGYLYVSCPTESAIYKFMRNFGGDAYHGHTHESNAYDVERILSKYFDVKLIGNLYFPISFFRIVECRPKVK